MTDNPDEILEKVISLKEESGLTFDELSIRSKVPLTSVKRYFNGETKSPGFFPLASIIVSLGGSVDEVLGIKSRPQQPANNEFTHHLQADLRYERKRKEQWVILFLILVAIYIALLIFDLFHPEMGYIQYAEQMAFNTQQTSCFFI